MHSVFVPEKMIMNIFILFRKEVASLGHTDDS